MEPYCVLPGYDCLNTILSECERCCHDVFTRAGKFGTQAFWKQSKRTLVSQIERCDGLEWPKGEVLVHQNVMKTNLKTAGSYE